MEREQNGKGGIRSPNETTRTTLVISQGLLKDLVLLEQIEHGLGGLGALLEPGLRLLGVDADLFAGTGDGVHEAQHLHGAASGDAVVLGDDDVVERALLGTIASKTDRKHGHSLSRKVYLGKGFRPSVNSGFEAGGREAAFEDGLALPDVPPQGRPAGMGPHLLEEGRGLVPTGAAEPLDEGTGGAVHGPV